MLVSAKEKAGPEENFMGIGEAPDWFKAPIFLITEFWRDETKAHFSTPYGKMPYMVIGADDKLYFFENIYFFDSEGRAVKYELINLMTEKGQTLEESLKDWVDETKEIKRGFKICTTYSQGL